MLAASASATALMRVIVVVASLAAAAAENLRMARGTRCLDQLEDALAHARLADLVVGAHQFERLALDQRILLLLERGRLFAQIDHVAATARSRLAGCLPGRRRHLIEEVGDGHVEHLGELVQPAGADAIRPLLVLLDLLKREADGVTDSGLAHAEQATALANASADMNINRMASCHGVLPRTVETKGDRMSPL